MSLRDDLNVCAPRLRRFARALVDGHPAPNKTADDLVQAILHADITARRRRSVDGTRSPASSVHAAHADSSTNGWQTGGWGTRPTRRPKASARVDPAPLGTRRDLNPAAINLPIGFWLFRLKSGRLCCSWCWKVSAMRRRRASCKFRGPCLSPVWRGRAPRWALFPRRILSSIQKSRSPPICAWSNRRCARAV